MIEKKLAAKGPRQLPKKIKDRLSLREATLIESHRLDLPGVMIEVESQRNYLEGVVGGHLIGYVGEVSGSGRTPRICTRGVWWASTGWRSRSTK